MRLFGKTVILISLLSQLWAVGEAGGIFLLIAPGAGPASMGEAQVAKSDDAYASYFNPAGLAFLEGRELSLMHVNWLPNLADDLYYDFVAYRQSIPNLGTLGGHFILLDLGEQIRTNEEGIEIGTFRSNMWAATFSWGTMLSPQSGIGVSAKIFHQNLSKYSVAGEEGSGKSTDFAFDVGYLKRWETINFGIAVTNIGPKITFKDDEQADPTPTNMRFGIMAEVFNDGFNRLNILVDANKLLVAAYPRMDWDENGYIGGYDEDGNLSVGGKYSKDGDIELPHTDSWYKAIFTSWLDDWYLGGDIDYTGVHQEDPDGQIGGFIFTDAGLDGDPAVIDADGSQGNGAVDAEYRNEKWEYPEMEESTIDNPDAVYNSSGIKEKGSKDDRKFSTEIKEMVYNIGVEYWYADLVAIRAGYIYDEEGKIKVPTFGAGIRAGERLGFDFGYTAGDEGHPRANTMYFSLNMMF